MSIQILGIEDALDPVNIDKVDPVNPNGEPTDPADPTNGADDAQPNDDANPDDPDDELTLVKELAQKIGHDGDYEDSIEGIATMVREASEKLADEKLNSVIGRDPRMKAYFEYVTAGGNPEEFLQIATETDWSKVNYDESNEALQETILRNELTKLGMSAEDIRAEIDEIKAGGILASKARRSLANLVRIQEKERNEIVANQQRFADEQRIETEKYWNNVKEAISKKSELKGLNLPESDRGAFYDYLTKPVKDGKTQREIDAEQLDMESLLAVDFLLFKGFKLGELVTRKAKDLNATSLRNRITRTAPSGEPAQGRTGVPKIAGI